MFRISLSNFFNAVLTSGEPIMHIDDGRYTLEWIAKMIIPHPNGAFVDRGFRFRCGGAYRKFTVTFELDVNPGILDYRLVDLVNGMGILRSVSDHGEIPKDYLPFPHMPDLLRYGLNGIVMVVAPIEPAKTRSGGY